MSEMADYFFEDLKYNISISDDPLTAILKTVSDFAFVYCDNKEFKNDQSEAIKKSVAYTEMQTYYKQKGVERLITDWERMRDKSESNEILNVPIGGGKSATAKMYPIRGYQPEIKLSLSDPTGIQSGIGSIGEIKGKTEAQEPLTLTGIYKDIKIQDALTKNKIDEIVMNKLKAQYETIEEAIRKIVVAEDIPVSMIADRVSIDVLSYDPKTYAINVDGYCRRIVIL